MLFTYRNSEEAGHATLLESLGGGIALFDYDGDGLLDIFVTGGGYFDGPDKKQIQGYPNRLYKNLGNWKFKDVTKEVGLDQPVFYTHGCAVADYDRDGWPDLLVTGWGRLVLYHNVPDPNAPGRRRFMEVTEKAGLNDRLWSTSAAWADLDGDGFPDLYVCHYLDWSFANNKDCGRLDGKPGRDVCPPRPFKPLPHSLYRNNGAGTFLDISNEIKLRRDGRGLGVVILDINDDGRPDIYVANDAGDNFLYMNRGNWHLHEKGLRAGVALDDRGVYMGSMGVDAVDFDASGRPSLFVTNFQTELHALYWNLGEERFQYFSHAGGLVKLGRQFVGFGTAFLDVDNDGWEDLAIANGHVLYHPPSGGTVKQRPVLMRNVDEKGWRVFEDLGGTPGPYWQSSVIGRGLAVGDLDNDGWPDLVISHQNEPVVLLQNDAKNSLGQKNHWLGIQLIGRGNRDVGGAKLTLEVGGRHLTRFTKGGGSYLSSGDRRILFGLGAADKVGSLTVKWPWGKTDHWDHLPVDRYWRIREGEKVPASVHRDR